MSEAPIIEPGQRISVLSPGVDPEKEALRLEVEALRKDKARLDHIIDSAVLYLNDPIYSLRPKEIGEFPHEVSRAITESLKDFAWVHLLREIARTQLDADMVEHPAVIDATMLRSAGRV